MMSLVFTKSNEDSNLYCIFLDGIPIIFILYDDELLIIGNEKLIIECKRDLVVDFEMK